MMGLGVEPMTPQGAVYLMHLTTLLQAIQNEHHAGQLAWTAWEQEARAAGVPESQILERKRPWLAWTTLAARLAGVDIPNEMQRIQQGGDPGTLAQFDPPPPPNVPTGAGGGLSMPVLVAGAVLALVTFGMPRGSR